MQDTGNWNFLNINKDSLRSLDILFGIRKERLGKETLGHLGLYLGDGIIINSSPNIENKTTLNIFSENYLPIQISHILE